MTSAQAEITTYSSSQLVRLVADVRRRGGREHPTVDLNRWMYAGGRPNRVARALNRFWAAVWARGLWPSRMNTLEVRGRRSGKPCSLPVVIADYGGERYLVSMLGERAGWVANVRAAGGSAVLRHGDREAVRLEEVDPRDRAPIIKRYVEVAPTARTHFSVDWRAPAGEFERIAADHPVFRIRAARAAVTPA
jgi:deazaflavin-dependent oxidoreductase (nitroreductase family)